MKDEILKGLYYLQDLPDEKFSPELLHRFIENLLPKLIAYVQATQEPDDDIFEAAKEIFG